MGGKLTDEQTELLLSIAWKNKLGESLGPFLMALVLDGFLCGIALVQFSEWFSCSSRHDGKLMKFHVYFGMFVSIGSTIVLIIFMLKNFVYMFGLFRGFTDPKFQEVFVCVTTCAALNVQSFYAQRIYRMLNGSKLFLVAFIFCVIGSFATAIGALVQLNTVYHSILDAPKLEILAYLGWGFQVAGDSLITLCTSYALWKSKTGWSRTDKMLHRMVAYTFETQLPPIILAITGLALYIQNTGSTNYICITFILNKPYIIGMLAVLNARSNLRAGLANPTGETFRSSRAQQSTTVHFGYGFDSTSEGPTAIGSQQSYSKPGAADLRPSVRFDYDRQQL